jgi:23S rRNA pseudouridine1911/1915/1917 synthase
VQIAVLAEDATYLYLCKPAGLPVFPRVPGEEGESVLSRLLVLRPEQASVEWPQGFWGGIVHRLDNGTSGLLVVARSLAALQEGRALFTGGSLGKSYLLVSDGDVHWNEHRVDHVLSHHPSDRRKMVWQRGGSTKHRGLWRPATTEFRRLDGALWEAKMSTGVRHQIRLHAASVGLALRGDKLYGGGDGRFCLHHKSLAAWPSRLPEVPMPDEWPGQRGAAGPSDDPGAAS